MNRDEREWRALSAHTRELTAKPRIYNLTKMPSITHLDISAAFCCHTDEWDGMNGDVHAMPCHKYQVQRSIYGVSYYLVEIVNIMIENVARLKMRSTLKIICIKFYFKETLIGYFRSFIHNSHFCTNSLLLLLFCYIGRISIICRLEYSMHIIQPLILRS